MFRVVLQVLLAVWVLALLPGCATLQKFLPVTTDPSTVKQRVAVAMASLESLETVDTYIKLDNSRLREQIDAGLQAQASDGEAYRLARLKVRFERQVITLEATLEITSDAGNTVTAVLRGDVILAFSGNQLIWLPQFKELEVSNTDFFFEDAVYVEAPQELEQELLQRVNREITDPLIVLGKNMVRIDPLPLGHIEAGVALSNFGGISSSTSHQLGGVFTVAASAILVEPDQTSIALDLEFIPNISPCTADVRVTRSAFALEISDREPVGVIRLLNGSGTDSHFFTEISGATRSTSVIHYWFADGRPVALEELPVNPSYRWRTWSSKKIDPREASNWEVIVVEKESGCILHSNAISTHSAADEDSTQDRQDITFDQFRIAFEERMADFSILHEHPEIALIELPRPFLRDTLHDSLKDLQIVVSLDIGEQPRQKHSGTLLPFNAGEIVCAERDCTATRECDTGYSQCARLRDSRDCTTCLIRNPLNNRCINEGTDPICEAARTAQNAKYDAARDACVEQETIASTECGKLVAQELRSCEIEAAGEQSACEGGREAATAFSGAESFAAIDLQFTSQGRLNAIFSDMQIEGDLQNLRLNLGFGAALHLRGKIRFAPARALGPLAECMNAWQTSFDAMVVLPQLASEMIGVINRAPSELSTRWSGYVVPASINPAPLEAMFADNPNLLADCQIGLTAAKVLDGIRGPARDYLTGSYPLEIQPAPSRILLGKARVEFGGQSFLAEPQLTSTHLRFEVQE